MAETFSNNDDGYKRWRFAHPTGYVLTAASPSKLTLHHAGCSSLDPGDDKPLTATTKVCDVSVEGLQRWAHAEHGTEPSECGHCNPLASQATRPGSSDRARSHPGS